ncbi:MAG TPA: Wzz/FepE/Etk N-terminal domain-containing protein [Candidatus Kapabacteria bacterium]|nr:Wzz/FepE/Etk N-terminal domain-containing protein [Candidatus Kapabacteria bacterium]
MSSSLSEIKPSAPTIAAGGNSLPAINEDGQPSNLPPLTPARKAWVENITIIFQHKALIVTVTAIVTIATGIYAFMFMPNYYSASAVILPARHEGGGLDNITSGIASSLKDIGLTNLHGGGGEDSYTPLSLMRSRELMGKIVQQFNFVSVYKSKNLPDAIDVFNKHLDGELTEEGNFTVTFQDTNAVRAAQVTNAVVGAINDVNSRLAKDEARHNISASQARYEQNVADLDSAEAALGAFQQKYGVFALPQQAQAELTTIAELEAQKYAAEIQLQNAEQLYGSNSSEVTVYRNTVDQLAGKLGEMQAGQDIKANSFVPTNVMPDVALQYLRLMREVEIQSKLKAFLLPEYEEAKLDEVRNMYGFVTLDSATVPVHKAGPHRSIILLAALVGTAIIMAICVIILTNIRRMRMNFVRDQHRILS